MVELSRSADIRGAYSRFIDEARRPQPTPKRLVDEQGTCAFGTFDREFESMDLVNARKPTHAPQGMNRLKLTLWEATEVHLKDGLLLAVVCDMGIFGKTLNVFYDKRTKTTYCWDTNLKSRDTLIAPNLMGGAVAEGETDVSHVLYENRFDRGECHLAGNHRGPCLVGGTERSDEPTIEYDFQLERVSKPSVVSIPFGPNRPLYSQKDLFKVTGRLVFNGEELAVDENATAVIDDHRGYYPRHAHYDWVSTMGCYDLGGVRQRFGFNLTRNQSIDQERYNENLIWLEGATSTLPPVTFERDLETADFSGHAIWRIRDEHDMVDVTFDVQAVNPMIMHALVVKIDYYIVFGMLSGFLRDETGKKYQLDGMLGIGEDKTLLL